MRIIREENITTGTLDSSSVPIDDYPIWSDSENYDAGDRVVFGIEIWESKTGGNQDNQPDESPDEWTRMGFVNRWRGLRDATDSLTEHNGDIEYVINPGTFITAIAFMNVFGDAAVVELRDSENYLIHSETKQIVDFLVGNWFDWYFQPYTFRENVVFIGLPPISDAEITVKVTQVGTEETRLGRLVIGTFTQIGITQHGTTVSELDFRPEERDGLGNLTLSDEGRVVRLVNYRVFMRPEDSDTSLIALRRVRRVPAVFVGSENFSSTIIFGLYRDYVMDLTTAGSTNMTIEVIGF